MSENMEAIIKQAADSAVEKASEQFEKTVDERLGGYGMVKDKKESIAKFFAKPKPTEAEMKTGHLKDDGLAKGHAFARFAKMKLQHKLSGSTQPLDVFMAETAEKHYGQDKNFVKMVKSGFTKSMVSGKVKTFEEYKKSLFNNSSIPEDGGYLVPEMYGEIIELLREKVFLFQAGARVVPMSRGNINLPIHNSGALSFFRGEGKRKKGKKQGLKNLKMTSKNQVSMVIMTNELIMRNDYNADQAFLDDVLKEMAITMNETALTGAGTEFTPRGIDNTTGVNTLSSLGAKVDGDTAATMIGEIMKTNIPMEKMGFVMNGVMWAQYYNATDGNGAYIFRDEMNKGTLSSIPFFLFNKIAVGTTGNKETKMYLADWNEFLVGEEMMFDVATSTEATVYDEDENAIDLFAQNMMAIRVESFYDFGIAHPEGFVILPGIHTI